MLKKILFIDHDKGQSGSTVSLGYLVGIFKNSGYDIYILTPKSKEKSDYLVQKGAKIIKYGNRFIHTMFLDLHFYNEESIFNINGAKILIIDLIKVFYGMIISYKTFSKLNPDLVYINEYVCVQAAFVAKLMKIPSVIHIRSLFITGSFGLRNYLLSKAIVKFNSMVICITEVEATQIKGVSEKDRSKIKIVGEFIDDNNFGGNENIEILRTSLGIPISRPIVIMVGGIQQIKGTFYFLAAAEKLIKENFDSFFILLGRAEKTGDKVYREYYNKCLTIINFLKDKNSILVTNEINNPIDYIKCSDVLISYITKTHFSRPIIEAWACKKPVITTDNMHALNMVKNKFNGVIVKTYIIDELVEAIKGILQNSEQRVQLGQNGYNTVHEDFNFQINSRKIGDLCTLLLGNSKFI